MRIRGVTLWALFLTIKIFHSASIAQERTEAIDPALRGTLVNVQHLETADSANVWNYSIDDSSLIDFPYFFPAVFRNETALKRYIRDPRFLQLRRIADDTVAVDVIFLRAMDIADESVGHALLIATLATFDHFRLGVRIPILGTMYVPLTLESESSYRIRYSHLPRRVLPDSLGSRKNDKDKMQHFFGSAYLTYVFNSKAVSRALGDLIEWGEPHFIVGGDFDERDKYANRLGQEFGMRLLEGEDLLPSDVLWRRSKEGREKREE